MITFDKTLKLEAAVAKKDVRYYLNDAHYSAEHRQLVATDGNILAVIPIEDASGKDVTGSVPVQAIKDARKLASDGKSVLHLESDKTATLSNAAEYPRDCDSKFPDYRRVIPKSRSYEIELWINPDLLKNLADAIIPKGHDRYLKLRINPTNGQVIESIGVSVSKCDNYGVIMPVRPPKEGE